MATVVKTRRSENTVVLWTLYEQSASNVWRCVIAAINHLRTIAATDATKQTSTTVIAAVDAIVKLLPPGLDRADARAIALIACNPFFQKKVWLASGHQYMHMAPSSPCAVLAVGLQPAHGAAPIPFVDRDTTVEALELYCMYIDVIVPLLGIQIMLTKQGVYDTKTAFSKTGANGALLPDAFVGTVTKTDAQICSGEET